MKRKGNVPDGILEAVLESKLNPIRTDILSGQMMMESFEGAQKLLSEYTWSKAEELPAKRETENVSA